MKDFRIILNRDLAQYSENDMVCVTGVIFDRWGKKENFGISLKDLTGSINVSFWNNRKQYSKEAFVKGKRVRIYATVVLDRKENKCLSNVENVEYLEEINQLNKELDIFEQ